MNNPRFVKYCGVIVDVETVSNSERDEAAKKLLEILANGQHISIYPIFNHVQNCGDDCGDAECREFRAVFSEKLKRLKSTGNPEKDREESYKLCIETCMTLALRKAGVFAKPAKEEDGEYIWKKAWSMSKSGSAETERR